MYECDPGQLEADFSRNAQNIKEFGRADRRRSNKYELCKIAQRTFMRRAIVFWFLISRGGGIGVNRSATVVSAAMLMTL